MLSALLVFLAVAASAQAQPPSVQELNDRMIHRRAVEAVIWGIPAVNTDLMRRQMLTKTPGKIGRVIYWGRPLDFRNQTLTPNPDALYFMVFFDTTEGPIVLDLPPGDANGSFNGFRFHHPLRRELLRKSQSHRAGGALDRSRPGDDRSTQVTWHREG
jgi:hypothetical protein